MAGQLALDERWTWRRGRSGLERHPQRILCAGCHAREARYGFRDDDHPVAGRPRTLCFECFRTEITRREAVAARLARGWNAHQVRLPLERTLESLHRRRRRAQIAARRVVDAAGDAAAPRGG
ncbi:MAG: hypothetical protein HY657_18095 [Acidobacteria bacterium]|nr:hypothetical protein [Acidobacteriota bacterium]